MKDQKPKYSLLEIEKRWLVNKDKFPDLSGLIMLEITDKYFPETRTRLRRVLDTKSNETVFKLTKKYGKISSFSEPIATLYLSENEFNFFNSLKGNILEKKVYRYPYFENTFLIEIFINPKADFILLETEAGSEDRLNSLIVPEFVTGEVTGECKYEGYSIAGLSDDPKYVPLKE